MKRSSLLLLALGLTVLVAYFGFSTKKAPHRVAETSQEARFDSKPDCPSAPDDDSNIREQLEKLRRENAELRQALSRLPTPATAANPEEETKTSVSGSPDKTDPWTGEPQAPTHYAQSSEPLKNEGRLPEVSSPTQSDNFLRAVRLDNAFKAMESSQITTKMTKTLTAMTGIYDGPVKLAKGDNQPYRMRVEIQTQDGGGHLLDGVLNFMVFRGDREIIGNRNTSNINRVRTVQGSDGIWFYFDRNVIQAYRSPNADFLSINWYKQDGPASYEFYGSGTLPASY